jgi:hypothetical protein
MPTAKSLERDIKNFTRDKDSLKIKKDNLEKDLRDMLAEEEIKFVENSRKQEITEKLNEINIEIEFFDDRIADRKAQLKKKRIRQLFFGVPSIALIGALLKVYQAPISAVILEKAWPKSHIPKAFLPGLTLDSLPTNIPTYEPVSPKIYFNDDTARSIVEEWLDAKKEIFGKEYDKNQLLPSLLTGNALSFSQASLNYLKRGGYHYGYEVSKLNLVWPGETNFIPPENARAIIRIYEIRRLFLDSGEERFDRTRSTSSGDELNNFEYKFSYDRSEERWKISDYCPWDSELKKCYPR